jgi:hypothetical protein
METSHTPLPHVTIAQQQQHARLYSLHKSDGNNSNLILPLIGTPSESNVARVFPPTSVTRVYSSNNLQQQTIVLSAQLTGVVVRHSQLESFTKLILISKGISIF